MGQEWKDRRMHGTEQVVDIARQPNKINHKDGILSGTPNSISQSRR